MPNKTVAVPKPLLCLSHPTQATPEARAAGLVGGDFPGPSSPSWPAKPPSPSTLETEGLGSFLEWPRCLPLLGTAPVRTTLHQAPWLDCVSVAAAPPRPLLSSADFHPHGALSVCAGV